MTSVAATANPVTEDPPDVRVLMAARNPDGSPRFFFTVSLLQIESWIEGGYKPVMFDPDDWFAYVRWQNAQVK